MTIKGIWFVIAPIIIYILIYLGSIISFVELYDAFNKLDTAKKVIIMLGLTMIMVLLDIIFMATIEKSFFTVPIIDVVKSIYKYISKFITWFIDFCNKHLTIKI